MSKIGPPRLHATLDAIDRANAADPGRVHFAGEPRPLALVEGERAHAWITHLLPEPAEPLQIAARGHHIRRWTVPRETYPRSREGYHEWRTYLYSFHAGEVGGIMRNAGYSEDEIEHTSRILHKRGIKSDPDVQAFEDAVSLTFIELRLAEFASTVSDEQLLRALRRTWAKMSAAGHAAAASIAVDDPTARVLAALRT